ncbi:hypothetical protein Btru_066495 [Bulinus truncatus]|nr:hypothetical protein Btru_066495 [Bulinus truncatus]
MDECPTTCKRLKMSKQDTADAHDVNEANFDFTPHPAVYDQGKHEIEVVQKNYECAIAWKRCTKNPGHSDFIPAASLSLTHLPIKFRDEDIFRFIKLWVQLTVKLTIGTTSKDRTSKDPFYGYSGSSFSRTGTGKVTDVYSYTEDDDPCPCPECSVSKTPAKTWKAIWIMTAMHVVFDDEEVEATTAEFFYDSEQAKGSTVKLRGLRVVDFNRKGDWCKFECVTHDLDFGEKIEGALSPMVELGDQIQEKFKDDQGLNMAVIASHPHGCAKFVTIGEWRDVEKFEEEARRWTTYSYSTATCKGSSGAPVWILGSDRHHMYAYYSHVHSEGGNPANGEPNKSGAGDVIKTWE